MTVKLLMNPRTGQPAARMIPNQEVQILEEDLLKRITICGISVSKQFLREHNTRKLKPAYRLQVYPSDEKALFAKAFELFEFVHGLQQSGYYWRDEKDVHIFSPGTTDRELAKYIMGLHKKEKPDNQSSMPSQ